MRQATVADPGSHIVACGIVDGDALVDGVIDVHCEDVLEVVLKQRQSLAGVPGNRD